MALLFGVHAIDNGGIDMAARRAAAAGFDALQIFTAIPKFYGDKSSIREERVERFLAALDETGIDPANVIVHGAYVLNLANPDEEKWGRARDGLAKELERSNTLGVGGVCFHPGSATDGDAEAGLERISRAMTEALDRVEGPTKLYIENTAGAGRTLGRTPDEVGAMLDGLPKRHADRVGYGLDTCHLYASGYDIAESPESLRAVLDEFQERTGMAPSFFHLNDSEGALGSNRDRHRLLGAGEIGAEPFGWLIADERAHGVPLILETPQELTEVDDEDATPDPYDVAMIELLRSLAT